MKKIIKLFFKFLITNLVHIGFDFLKSFLDIFDDL